MNYKNKIRIARFRYLVRITILYLGFTGISMFFLSNLAIARLEKHVAPWKFENAVVIEGVHAESGLTGTGLHQDDTLAQGDSQEGNGSTDIQNSTSPLVLKIRAAFPETPDVAVAVAQCESHMDASREGDMQMEKHSYGLFQINQTWHPYSKETLVNPDENIKIARKIFDSGGWNRWSCYRFGYYEKYLNQS